MKIIKKPKILPCKCEGCGGEFLPKYRDLEFSYSTLRKDRVTCPFCKQVNYVKFEVE
jgi:hypothetical protein